MSTLGLDIGTSGCKAVAFDDAGRALAADYRAYDVRTPREGWAQLDPDEVSGACLAVVRVAARAAAEADDSVRALCISSQGEAFAPVDGAGRVIGPAMVSSDARAAALAESWSEEFGRRRLYEITGHTAHPMFSLFKALWLARNEPDTWRRTARLHCFEDLLHRRLGVEPAMSWPLAGRTMLFDVRRHDWSDEILGAAGIGRAMLPRTLPAGAVVGTVPDAVARDLALAPRALVVAGGHDQTVGALGVGATEPGVAMYATGTVECICPCLGAEPRFTDDLFRSNLCTYDFTMPGHYTTVAFSLTGGNLLQWFRDEFGRNEVEEARRTGLNAYDLLLAALPPEPTRLLVLPHFTPTGTPHFDVHSTGAILGLRLTTRREEVLRALLEGVAFEMRLNMAILEQSGLPVTRLVASGGGARNLRWVQLKADVMGKPITTTATTEAGCLGAAILARAAHARRRVDGLAREMTRETGLVAPDETRAAWYAERFELYRQLYPALRPFSRQA